MTFKGKLPARFREPVPQGPGTPQWEERVQEIEDFVGYKICAAKAGGKALRDKGGFPCSQPLMTGRTRCRMHGGATPRGPAASKFIHGRNSFVMEHIPSGLRAAFEATAKDPEMLNLRTDIALSDARQAELIRRIRFGENSDSWARLHQLRGELLVAMAEGYQKRVQDLMQEWADIMEGEANQVQLWDEVRRLSDHRRKLVNTERMRRQALQGYVTAERVLTIIANITDLLARHVPKMYLPPVIEGIKRMLPGPDTETAPLPAGNDGHR